MAHTLVDAGLGVLLLDLLTAPEALQDASTGHLSSDVALLSERVSGVIHHLSAGEEEWLPDASIGCLAAEVGAAATLVAATEHPSTVRAVALRSASLDLLDDQVLQEVRAPTLLIAGGADPGGIAAAQRAQRAILGETALETVSGATGGFSERGTLKRAADLTANWFGRHLQQGSR